MSNWISVEDELPDNFTWVLISVIFAGKLITTMAYFETQGDEIYWLAHNNLDQGDEWNNVIGWQQLPEPMPEPPKGE